jgi:16S rRNA G966 N2-methylase RsmD
LSPLAPDTGFTLIFIDPPYGQGFGVKAAADLDRHDLVNVHGLLVIEDMAGSELPEHIGRLTLYDARNYGETGFWFYARERHYDIV